MSTLSITRDYSDGDDLTEAQLDAANDSIETWANGNIGSTNIATSGVEATNIAASAVTAAKIASDAVTTAKILDANVTTAKIADLNVTTGKINDLAVTTGKIAANAVTRAKLEALGHQVSSSCGTFSRSAATYAQITNFSVAFTTSSANRPVRIEVIPDGTTSLSYIGLSVSSTFSWKILRDSTDIAFGQAVMSTGASVFLPVNGVGFLDTGASASTSYTYSIQLKGDGSGTVSMNNAKMLVYET